MLDLLVAVLAQTGPASVAVSTWTQGKAELSGVAELLRSGQVTQFRLLVDRSFVARHPEYVRQIHGLAGADAVRQTKTHAKFALIAAGQWRITIRTSMNFNHNPRLEQFDLDDDAAIYAFFAGVVGEVFEVAPAGMAVAESEIGAGFERLRFGMDRGHGFDYGGFRFASYTGS